MMKTSETLEQSVMITKAMKYEIVLTALLETMEFSSWYDEARLNTPREVSDIVKSLEPIKFKNKQDEVMNKWIKEYPDEAREKGLLPEEE